MSVAIQTMEKERGTPFADQREHDAKEVEEDSNVKDSEKNASKPDITKTGPHDVLLGRGGGTNNHAGNVKFRKLVNEHKPRYLASSKVDKPKVARAVVNLWRELDPPGRFLQKKDDTKRGPGSVRDAEAWIEVDEKKAREKASQCLREKTPEAIDYLSHLRQQQNQMTEQGVAMLQQLQKNQANNFAGRVADVQPLRSVSLSNVQDKSNMINNNRRVSLPATALSPVGSELPGREDNRRSSLPANRQMEGQALEAQQFMVHQQQVVNDAYTAIERSGNVNPNSAAGMQLQRNMMADQQALLQQQFGNASPQGMMMNPMMQQQQQQFVPNPLMPQGQEQMMRAVAAATAVVNNPAMSPSMVPMSPTQRGQNLNQAFTHMNSHARQLQEQQRHLAQEQQRLAQMQQNLAHEEQAARQQAEMVRLQQQQQALAISSQTSPQGARHNSTGPLAQNIPLPFATTSEDLEPLPYSSGQTDPLLLPVEPDKAQSEPLPYSPKASPMGRADKPSLLLGVRKKGVDSNGTSLAVKGDEGANPFEPYALSSLEVSEKKEQPAQQKDQDVPASKAKDSPDPSNGVSRPALKKADEGKREAGDANGSSNDYQKTLTGYLDNHRVTAQEVDIDDEISVESLRVDGVNTSAWVEDALNRSGDFSLNNKGSKRGVQRCNSKTTISMGTSTEGMSLAFSEMEQSTELSTGLSTPAEKMRAMRSMPSNQSVMSELTDFGDLDCT